MNLLQVTISRIRGGQSIQVANDHLTKLLEAIESTGKTGSLKMELKIEPIGGKQYKFSLESTPKTPTPTVGTTVLYMKNGEVSDKDPDQAEFSLTVTSNPQPYKLKQNGTEQ
jgi:hypothetical protein